MFAICRVFPDAVTQDLEVSFIVFHSTTLLCSFRVGRGKIVSKCTARDVRIQNNMVIDGTLQFQ